MDIIKVISEEHLKTILKNLTSEEIVEHAYKNWIPSQKTGITILNLETGEVQGIGVELNDIAMLHMAHIKLFTIDSYNQIINEEEIFTPEEYEDYLDFKENDPSEYTPDIVSEFCLKNNINEEKRNISVLAYKFDCAERLNYNMWESKILNEYYDIIL